MTRFAQITAESKFTVNLQPEYRTFTAIDARIRELRLRAATRDSPVHLPSDYPLILPLVTVLLWSFVITLSLLSFCEFIAQLISRSTGSMAGLIDCFTIASLCACVWTLAQPLVFLVDQKPQRVVAHKALIHIMSCF